MKTAMQYLKNDILIEKQLGFITENASKRIIDYIDNLYLEKEKEQIMFAYYAELFNFINGKQEFINAEEYYKQTYNNDNNI
jgi:hypothetical protein